MSVKDTILFETKRHYGGPELVYVVSEHKEPLQTLTGSKTLTDRHVKALKELGFVFEEAPKSRRVLSERIDKVASDLESEYPQIALALDRISDRLEGKIAGIDSWMKKLISKIPGLPSKDKAIEMVAPMVQKEPKKFDRLVNEIEEMLRNVPVAGLGRTAFDIKGLIRGIKTITDPKVILAVISLMDSFETSDAEKLRNKIWQ